MYLNFTTPNILHRCELPCSIRSEFNTSRGLLPESCLPGTPCSRPSSWTKRQKRYDMFYASWAAPTFANGEGRITISMGEVEIKGYSGDQIRSFSDWEAYAMPPERKQKHWKEGRSAFELGRVWMQKGE